MAALVSTVRTVLMVPPFLATIYLAYACMNYGPSGKLRRWGAVTWWRLAGQ